MTVVQIEKEETGGEGLLEEINAIKQNRGYQPLLKQCELHLNVKKTSTVLR